MSAAKHTEGPRNRPHKGRAISISGPSTACMVWVDDKPVLGTDHRFKSIQAARGAAIAYIERHAAPQCRCAADARGGQHFSWCPAYRAAIAKATGERQ